MANREKIEKKIWIPTLTVDWNIGFIQFDKYKISLELFKYFVQDAEKGTLFRFENRDNEMITISNLNQSSQAFELVEKIRQIATDLKVTNQSDDLSDPEVSRIVGWNQALDQILFHLDILQSK